MCRRSGFNGRQPEGIMTEENFNQLTGPLRLRMLACALTLLHEREAAADCVQETLLRLWQSRSRLAAIDRPEAYCIAAVRRNALDMLRRTAKYQQVDILEADGALTDDTPERSAEIRDRLRMVTGLLGQLPERQKMVVSMSAIDGLDNAEIAQATGISDENVRVLLSRGRSRLKELYSRLH